MIAVYIRVSSHDQNPESQRSEIQRWLDQNRSGDARWFEDQETGKTLQRPAFRQLQQAIRKGEIDTVVVWKLDRLARRFRDGVKVMGDWLESDVRIVSVTQGFDLSGVAGQLIAAVLFAVAEMELDNIRQRQAAGIAAAKTRGVYHGRKAGTHKGSPKRAQQLQAQGLTVAEIGAALKISSRTVTRYLRA